jgi:hypothetical protein
VTSQTPGPGTYLQDSLSGTGRYANSKDRTSCVPLMKPVNHKKSQERVFARDFTRDVPGPGHYNP